MIYHLTLDDTRHTCESLAELLTLVEVNGAFAASVRLRVAWPSSRLPLDACTLLADVCLPTVEEEETVATCAILSVRLE